LAEQKTHIDPEFIESLKKMQKQQATEAFDKGDTWRVVVSKTMPTDGEELVVAEMYFDRRDGVTGRESAIDYMVKNFPMEDDYKVDAFRE